ncbi:MOSC N-terminal beta barrel domain-containing protein [Crucibulum laeve]|uniref:MOSC N-terminal beta barrel domain-containing protein n=1 Tax=Crucibulum laeve TaxID=68775 RepID=A0A5C3MDQ8_9AGAR|nr:MOSC N-terminal beta barrel domain-containing protein [Crucibulum laeve]
MAYHPLTLSHLNIDAYLTWTSLAVVLSIGFVLYRLISFRNPGVKDVKSCKDYPTKETIASMGASTNVDVTKERKAPPAPGQVTVSKILIHPIKSCRGTSVQSARYNPEGLENDRKWCIIDAPRLQVITARESPKMVLITPRIEVDASSPYGGVLSISFPEGSDCESFSIPLNPDEATLKSWSILPEISLWPTHGPIDGYICESLSPSPSPSASAILSKYFDKPVHLVFKGPRPREIDPTTTFPELKATAWYQDMYPLLVLSEESTVSVEEELRERVGTQGIEEGWRTGRVVIERFRPNIVFRGGGPFAEDDWEEIAIGSESAPRISLVSKCTRCLLPNVSPETGERDKAVPFKVLMKFRTGVDPMQKMKPCVGCNGVPDGDGVVRVGDVVFVKKMI